jgi:hypothetical protein
VEAAVIKSDLMLHTTQRLWMPIKKAQNLGFYTGLGFTTSSLGSRSYGFQVCRHDLSAYVNQVPDVVGVASVDIVLGYHWMTAAYHRGKVLQSETYKPGRRRIWSG